jgi:hypothetical protein
MVETAVSLRPSLETGRPCRREMAARPNIDMVDRNRITSIRSLEADKRQNSSTTDIPDIRRLIVSFCQVFYGTVRRYLKICLVSTYLAGR